MARSRKLTGSVRTASGHVHPDVAPSAGYRTAARRPCRSRGNAERRDVHGASLRPAAAQSRALHAGPRDGDSADGVVARTAGCARRTAREFRASKCRRRRCRRMRFPRRRRAKISTAPQLPLDFQWLRSPWPEELFSLTERPGHLRLYGRETIGQPVPAVAGRAAAAGALLQRDHGDRVRAGALPADGRA